MALGGGGAKLAVGCEGHREKGAVLYVARDRMSEVQDARQLDLSCLELLLVFSNVQPITTLPYLFGFTKDDSALLTTLSAAAAKSNHLVVVQGGGEGKPYKKSPRNNLHGHRQVGNATNEKGLQTQACSISWQV